MSTCTQKGPAHDEDDVSSCSSRCFLQPSFCSTERSITRYKEKKTLTGAAGLSCKTTFTLDCLEYCQVLLILSDADRVCKGRKKILCRMHSLEVVPFFA